MSEPPGSMAPEVPSGGQALGAEARAWLDQPALRAITRKLFGLDPGALTLGWPRCLTPEGLASWAQAGDVVISLARLPQDGRTRADLILRANSAAQLIDRVLGGEGAAANPGGPLSEAECGVLAYACARICAAVQLPWQVQDVRNALPAHAPHAGQSPIDAQDGPLLDGGEGTCEAGPPVLWPMAVRSELGLLDLRLVLRGAAIASFDAPALQIVVSDQLEPAAMSELQPGDVLLSDALALSLTTRGLTGLVELSVPGSDERWSARLEAGGLCVLTSVPGGSAQQASLRHTHPPQRASFVLAHHRVSFPELASLASGARLELGQVPHECVQLECHGQLVAEGELIVHQGALGLRVTRLPAASAG